MCDINRSVSELADVIRSETHLYPPQGGASSPPVSTHSDGDGMECASSCNSKEAQTHILGVRPLPAALSATTRRSRFQRQQEICEPGSSISQTLAVDTYDKGSLTPAMRKKYLKELVLNNGLNSGYGSILLPSKTSGGYGENDPSYSEEGNNYSSYWALDPMEHAWMLSVVDGNYETISAYLSSDLSLLTRKDFVSGFTALHWLAKYGKHETLIQLLKYAEKEHCHVDVNLKGSGGLTALHVAAMHSQFMVVKLLVGAFGAKIDIMDYNGRRAWQYLKCNAPMEMKELLGAWDDEHVSVGQQNVNNNSSGADVINCNTCEDEEPKNAFDRRNDSWRVRSFKKFFSPFLSFVNKN
ncbi:ankyrin repeat domain-containing protein SOWAHC [Clupea harengus]|uniref:Ankyrin repeat domain-containing protein SOWAHC n=1 Tax=Clupea harengus TaxID=7950 RepID=A0A6P3WFV0_CLUHA|nr:ankyrin repeat domain-containing protein SOWAHC [Clupea harengus]